MAYTSDDYDRNKIVTLRITTKVYNDLSKYVEDAEKNITGHVKPYPVFLQK